MKDEPNINTLDSRGCKPDLDLIGTNWRHTGNQNVYRITGYRWYGDDDLWLISFERVVKGIGTQYSRSITNFTEDRQSKPRFEQVWGLRTGVSVMYVNRQQADELEAVEKKILPYADHYSDKPSLRSMTKEEIEKQTTKIRGMDNYD